jgi:putative hydrolase of the HAD superfamily
MISTIIFDLGNVLVFGNYEKAGKRFSELNGRPLEENMEIMASHNEYMKGRVSSQDFAKRYMKKLSIPVSEQEFFRIYCDVFSLNIELFDLIKKLKKRFKLAILSNAEPTTTAFLEKKFSGLFQLFGHKIYSYNLRRLKPEKEIFEKALEITESRPEETIFIDDRLENVEAAKELGIKGIWYTDFQELKEELEKHWNSYW